MLGNLIAIEYAPRYRCANSSEEGIQSYILENATLGSSFYDPFRLPTIVRISQRDHGRSRPARLDDLDTFNASPTVNL